MKNAIAAGVVLLLIAGAFWGGMAYAGTGTDSAVPTRADGVGGQTGPADGFGGGPGGLTEDQRAEMQNMTQEERQTFMQEQFGDELPDGAVARGAGAMRGGLMEGEIIEAASDAITIALADGGSQIVYIDEETAIGFAEGVEEIAPGATATVLAFPEADGVTTAQAIVIE